MNYIDTMVRGFKVIGGFMKRHGKTIAKATGIVLGAFAEGYAESVNRKSVDTRASIDETLDAIIFAKDSEFAVIKGLADNAINMSWDSDKIEAAQAIRDAYINREDREIKSMAAKSLITIADSCDWDSDKQEITAMVTDILKTLS